MAGKKRAVVCDTMVGDHAVRVIGVHMSHRSEAVRVDSAEVLVEIAETSDLPTIAAGDLNSTPCGFPDAARDANGQNAIGVLDGSGYFRRSPEKPPVAESDMTFHSAEPTRVIDWILIPREWSFVEYSVESCELSDHRPVWAEIEVGSHDGG